MRIVVIFVGLLALLSCNSISNMEIKFFKKCEDLLNPSIESVINFTEIIDSRDIILKGELLDLRYNKKNKKAYLSSNSKYKELQNIGRIDVTNDFVCHVFFYFDHGVDTDAYYIISEDLGLILIKKGGIPCLLYRAEVDENKMNILRNKLINIIESHKERVEIK